MWEFLQSWPVALIGTNALGVGTNLVTPFVSRQIGSVNARRRSSAVRKIERSYNRDVLSVRKNIAMFDFIRFQCAAIIYIIAYFTLAIAVLLYNLQNINYGDKQEYIILIDYCDFLRPYVKIAVYVTFAFLGGLCLNRFLSQQQRSARIYHITRDKAKIRSDTLRKIMALDPQFDEKRLL